MIKLHRHELSLKARWGVAEWIERPLLMLEIRDSNPGHSASKNTII